jgi:cell division protein FtsX
VDRPVSSTTTDSNFIPHVLFLVIAILGFLIGGTFLLLDYAFTYKKAKNIARSAFKIKDE